MFFKNNYSNENISYVIISDLDIMEARKALKYLKKFYKNSL